MSDYLEKARHRLMSASRQHRHNTGGDELIPAYDYKETQKIVATLLEMEAITESNSKSNYGALECCAHENAELKAQLAEAQALINFLYDEIVECGTPTEAIVEDLKRWKEQGR